MKILTAYAIFDELEFLNFKDVFLVWLWFYVFFAQM